MQLRTPDLMARSGYIARGVVHTIVGSFAVVAALGSGGRMLGMRGALQSILIQPFGVIMLLVVALGLSCFAAWRIAQDALDVDQLGTDWKPVGRRIGFGVAAAANLALALSALALIFGMTSGSGDGESSARDWTAYLLAAPFGQWFVGAIGLSIVGIGVGAGVKGWKGTFAERLALDQNARRWVIPLGRLGFIARGLVFMLIGSFLVLAALHADARDARGLAGALREVEDQPYGWVLLALTALGLFAFGAFQFVTAYYRRINAPNLADHVVTAGEVTQPAVISADRFMVDQGAPKDSLTRVRT